MRKLRIVSQNVNHTPSQSHFILESLVGQCDILLVQEPYYGPIKAVVSNSQPRGETLIGTQIHPAWLLLETRSPARVCAYVNRELLDLRPQLCAHVVDHRDMLLMSLTVDRQVHYYLNVYNDERSTALQWLQDHAADLPPLDLIAGDFNLHSTAWEPDAPHESPRAVDLVNLMSGIGLSLANVDGAPTHRPHNVALRSTVPDLVFAPSDRVANGEVCVNVDLDGRGLSDHAILSTALEVGWWAKSLPPTIKRKSEAEREFIKDLLDGVAKVQVELGTSEDVQRTCNAVLAAARAAWDAHAVAPWVSSRSKRWWNDECTRVLTAFRYHRSAETRRIFKRAVKAAKAEYFEERIAAACEKGKRVWDVVSWTKPRSLPMYKSLVHEGRPLVELDELWEAVNSTYNSAAHREVDMSFL
ncbi:Endonuclease/exonuclease/phosphatase, partial [Daedaleopsis nitida]